MAGNGSAINRRRFLLASGAAMAGSGAAWGLIPGQRQGGVALPGPSSRPTPSATPAVPRAEPYGATTLQTAARLGGGSGGSGYRRLVSGAGWPMVVRGEIAAPRSGQEDRRSALACFVQFTDLHLADVQSPLRTEFMRAPSGGGWRTQEALTGRPVGDRPRLPLPGAGVQLPRPRLRDDGRRQRRLGGWRVGPQRRTPRPSRVIRTRGTQAWGPAFSTRTVNSL
jgi:hypothetical protein